MKSEFYKHQIYNYVYTYFRNLKSKENEKLNNLLDAMKDFFANKLCSTEDDLEEVHDKTSRATSDNAIQYCPNCMTRRGCSCDDCTVTHMMSCEGTHFSNLIKLKTVDVFLSFQKLQILL